MSCGIFPNEQKGCHKRTRGTEELLYIDQHLLNENKRRQKNLTMAWIDYKKAYDMFPRSWILHCLKLYKMPNQIIQLIKKTMQTWRVELTAGGQSLAKVKIERGIFKRDALSPLLFVIAMMPLNFILRKCTAGYKLSKSQEKINHLMYMDDIKLFGKNKKELETLIKTVRIYSQDIGMEFGIEKCTMLVMNSGKQHMVKGVELPNQVVIRTLKEKETYKYLRDIGSWHHQTTGNERKNLKRVSQKSQKITQDKTLL